MRLFMSYARSDIAFAQRLAQHLRAVGFDIWIDVENIPAGMKWSTAIQEGLDLCDGLIVVVTPDSMGSRNVEDEWTYFLDESKPLIPVLWKPAKTHFQLRRIQYVDFHQTEFDDALQNLLNELAVQGLEADGTSALMPAELLSGEPEGAAEILRILPSPFAWMEIPGGPVQLTTGGYVTPDMGETMVASFHIAHVPITNAQYAVFKEAGGYESREYWSDEGWRIMSEAGWQQPAFWDDEHFNGPQQPVVGVSWFEAMAFCRWLSAATGLAITLPMEQQWQRAAIGDAGHRFPWGDKIDTTYANFASAVGGTSPVTDYPTGASPYGVLDMSGNVWEWTSTDWHTGQTLSEAADPGGQPVLRGGSWYGLADFLRADHRYSGVRTLRYDDIGFRVMMNSLPATED